MTYKLDRLPNSQTDRLDTQENGLECKEDHLNIRKQSL